LRKSFGALEERLVLSRLLAVLSEGNGQAKLHPGQDLRFPDPFLFFDEGADLADQGRKLSGDKMPRLPEADVSQAGLSEEAKYLFEVAPKFFRQRESLGWQIFAAWLGTGNVPRSGPIKPHGALVAPADDATPDQNIGAGFFEQALCFLFGFFLVPPFRANRPPDSSSLNALEGAQLVGEQSLVLPVLIIDELRHRYGEAVSRRSRNAVAFEPLCERLYSWPLFDVLPFPPKQTSGRGEHD
jgi:hypothetical protein